MAVTEPDSPIHHLGGARTLLVVPMLKEDVLIGGMGIYRQEVRPFTDKQIDLVENFATQAVIAIENARLLNELRQRTDDLTESLEQQTATSEVLKIISSSPGELEPVFQAMLENAIRICEAKFGHLILFEGDLCCIRPRSICRRRWRKPSVNVAYLSLHGAAISTACDRQNRLATPPRFRRQIRRRTVCNCGSNA
jgi:hypothetical protein